MVEQAWVVRAVLEGERVEAIAARFHITAATVYLWLHRFTDGSMAELEDWPRRGRPPTYSREQLTTVIATASRLCSSLTALSLLGVRSVGDLPA